ncbi:MAG: class I SAM-dependent RNA methyltransferase [Treponema sp.]|nr:class I SAM-dependent RNA methyltransferase [Treponema sp.]MCL2251038.1 class I SAM-dependent RNA methyltransferase [Treponema sp.]
MKNPKNANPVFSVAALCAVGAEKVVSNELRKLNFKVDESLYGRVRFKTDTTGLYQALIGLRAADRVLLEIAQFKAVDFDALFEGTAAAEWEKYVPNGMGLKVAKVRTNRSQLNAETSIQAIVHKAAAQRLCGKYKVSRLPEPKLIPRSENGTANPVCAVKVAEVRVYIEKDTVSLLLDLSGEPLFKRGYRSEGGTAPLRETTAASILLLSGWKRKFPLYDPFCGSGTILIEAAMYAWDIAPGLGRNFAIENLLIADKKTEQNVRDEFRAKIDFSRLVRIAGSDEDLRSVSIASSNATRLLDIAEGRSPQRGIRVGEKNPGIDLKTVPMSNASSPFNEGFLVTNPPYGKRLGDLSQAEQIYKEMAGLEQRFPGWKIAVITDHSGFESFFGRKADTCREISNGAIPSYFFQYEV